MYLAYILYVRMHVGVSRARLRSLRALGHLDWLGQFELRASEASPTSVGFGRWCEGPPP